MHAVVKGKNVHPVLNPSKTITSHAYIDLNDTTHSLDIIAAVLAAPGRFAELYVPRTVLKMLLY